MCMFYGINCILSFFLYSYCRIVEHTKYIAMHAVLSRKYSFEFKKHSLTRKSLRNVSSLLIVTCEQITTWNIMEISYYERICVCIYMPT